MPKAKGKPRKEPTFRCYHCGSRKIKVGRGGNTRIIHGKKKVVAPCECPNCGAEWWSYHTEAIKAMKAADAKGRAQTVDSNDDFPADV